MIEHGWCLLWDKKLISVYVVSNLAFAISYFVIPFKLYYLRSQIEQKIGRSVLLLFASFIILCGATHLIDIIVLWYPIYWFQTGFLVPGGSVSVFTTYFMMRVTRRVFV